MGRKSQKDAPFFPIFQETITAFVKYCPFSQKLGALTTFFQFFHEKPNILSKNVNPVNTTLYNGPKK